MASKREREYARRRYEKQAARTAKAAQLRRERRIVLIVTVLAFAALATTLFLLNRNAQQSADGATTDPALTQTATSAVAPLPTTNPDMYQAVPPASDSLGQDWNVTITTTMGNIEMVLHGAEAPQAVANFLFLAENGFYDGTACHRLMPGSLLQCGDPTATGQGGPGYSWGPIENAPTDALYPAGTVAMARMGGDGASMGSQFFLVYNDVTLPADDAGGYSVFGEITSGLDILQTIGAQGVEPSSVGADGTGRPAIDVIITGVEVE